MDRLDNPVRPYPWGSAADIPEFRGVPGDGGPQAELWMGAHPGAPSLVLRDGITRSLAEVIAADPDAELGPAVRARFGAGLPFLLKLLAAARPLSLQVHPDLATARAAYAAQQRDPSAAADYTDGNHKPELICALRDGFEALSGFRPVADTIALLDELDVAELAAIRAALADAGPADPADPAADSAAAMRAVVTEILTGGGDHAPAIAGLAAAAGRVAAADGPWAAAGVAYAGLAAAYPADPGVLVALLLNHAVLAAGEALFTAAGVPHCYLSGFGAEVMAASDNVLRAGLTSKRVNVPELLRILDFRPAALRVLHPMPAAEAGVAAEAGAAEGEERYPVPVPDFRIGRLRLAGAEVKLPGGAPQILLVIAGTAVLRGADGAAVELSRGESAYLPARCSGATAAGAGTLLRATVGS
jgi:mannose-6-phosphate isomerase